jgi:hypothetical protein
MKNKYVVEIQYVDSDGQIKTKVVGAFDNWPDACLHNDQLMLDCDQRSSVREKTCQFV